MQAMEDSSGAVAATRDAIISALFVAEAPRLIALAQMLIGDRSAAEDLVQDCFVALYRRWPSLRDESAAAGYLTAAVVKGSRLRLRQRYAARDIVRRVGMERPADSPTLEAQAVLGEQRHVVLEALRALPLRQRQVVVLRYYADRSEKEIADLLAISRGSVKRHASRALASLTHVLEGTS